MRGRERERQGERERGREGEGEREGGREGRREINLFKGKSGYRNNRRWEIMLCLKTKE